MAGSANAALAGSFCIVSFIAAVLCVVPFVSFTLYMLVTN